MSSKFITGGVIIVKRPSSLLGVGGMQVPHLYNQNHDHVSVLLTVFGCCHCCIQNKINF